MFLLNLTSNTIFFQIINLGLEGLVFPKRGLLFYWIGQQFSNKVFPSLGHAISSIRLRETVFRHLQKGTCSSSSTTTDLRPFFRPICKKSRFEFCTILSLPRRQSGNDSLIWIFKTVFSKIPQQVLYIVIFEKTTFAKLGYKVKMI